MYDVLHNPVVRMMTLTIPLSPPLPSLTVTPPPRPSLPAHQPQRDATTSSNLTTHPLSVLTTLRSTNHHVLLHIVIYSSACSCHYVVSCVHACVCACMLMYSNIIIIVYTCIYIYHMSFVLYDFIITYYIILSFTSGSYYNLQSVIMAPYVLSERMRRAQK